MGSNISERVLNILEWNEILKELFQRCQTPIGVKVVTSLQPLTAEAARNQLRDITGIKEIVIQEGAPDFTGITDIQSIINIASKGGILSIEELALVKNFIISSNRIRRFINNHMDVIIPIVERFSVISDLKGLGEVLIPSITDDNELSTSKYPELKDLKEKIFNSKKEIEKRLHNLIYSSSMDKIFQEKIHTTINNRYVLLVKANMKGRVKGRVHDLSSSGATYYIEPDAVSGLNNQLIVLQMELQVEINRILRILSREVSRFSSEIIDNLNELAHFDFLVAASKFSISLKGNEPEISDDFIISLHDARHPLLYLMNPDTIVANDISIGKGYNCLIISGANTGGKTVLLKTVGLCALLTIYGLHIPASADSVIGIFSKILADIGDDQSISQSLSTYSGQIVIINEMIEMADRSTLALIDEIIVGTNPRQGAALAQAILESMIDTEAKMVITTHYSELKDLASLDGRFCNASVSFNAETLNPTFNLRIGIPGSSFAIEIARNYGMSEKIISRSRELIDDREITTEALIESIQKHKEMMDEEQKRIEGLKEQLLREKNRYIDFQSKVKNRIEEIRSERGIEFLEELRKHRDEIANRITDLQKSDIRALGKLQQDIIKIDDDISTKLKRDSKKRFSNSYIPFDPKIVEIGDSVFIVPLEREGRIESIDISEMSIQLLLGNSIKTRYKFDDLLIPKTRQGDKERLKAAKKIEKEGIIKIKSRIPQTVQTSYNTIDLRGLKVNDALFRIEQDFDRMIRNGISAAIVIHGHGTGALKKAVRSSLKFSPYVRDFRPGEYGEGGDGVSIVLLRD
ncbi:MAG: Smr/MutS family protein [Spirochaetota bacterium]|nr:Smr/MutS family protein [Spirochaetota bacterium]